MVIAFADKRRSCRQCLLLLVQQSSYFRRLQADLQYAAIDHVEDENEREENPQHNTQRIGVGRLEVERTGGGPHRDGLHDVRNTSSHPEKSDERQRHNQEPQASYVQCLDGCQMAQLLDLKVVQLGLRTDLRAEILRLQ